ncbi:MAG TPA: DUF4136 domain-containing protein [Cyclobacteriaceae bacterium]|nr:DUF4136 domain-containing protein [Cyclobacteriaceae bacterium]
MRLLLIALTAFLLGSCYPEGPEYTEDLDVVYTTYDQAYDFKAGSTYAMPNKIVVDAEKDNNGDWQPEYMPDAFAGPILAQIESNMTALGWTRLPNNVVTDEPNPDADIILTPAAMKNTNYFYSYWYDWWYYGWGGWYGWYYPPYYTVSSYTTGSMIMVIADPHVQTPINQTQAAWMAVGNGLFTGAYDLNRVKKAIDQSFAQSPYLKTN